MVIITPKAKNVVENGGSVKLCASVCEAFSAPFVEYCKKKKDILFSIGAKATVNVVVDKGLSECEYKLVASNDGVTITASGNVGAQYGFATLLQIIEKDGEGFSVPLVEIEDKPDSSYRGLMIDLARNWHEFDYLLQYVDICWYNKINVFHLHFTDDQSFTLPSRLFPKLPSVGRSYTFEQIKELVEYAKLRGVELMPEIDVPGHCVSFIQAYPDVFGNIGIITQTERSITAMQSLFSELCDMFPNSKYIHIGGDEANIAAWTRDADCIEYGKKQGITDTDGERLMSERFLAHFVTKMAEAVFAKGKQPIVWEGFCKEVNQYVSRDIIIMSWENFYQTTPELLDAGFTIINCSWSPFYIVTGSIMWNPEEIQNSNIFKWMPMHTGSPYAGKGVSVEPTDKVLGAQLLAWGDWISQCFPTVSEGVAKEIINVEERIGALSEIVWNKEKSE